MSKVHNLFISHSWSYSDAYENFCKLLDGKKYFSYRNHSIPKDDPVHTAGTDKELAAAIEARMRGCHVVVIMAGKYSTYSKWIKKEIAAAQGFSTSKPILGVKPWGNTQVSSVVQENADKLVGWNTDSIVAGIRELSI